MSAQPTNAANPYLEDRVKVTTSILGMLKHLWPYFMRHKFLFFTSMAAVFAVAASARLAVTLFGYAIDHGLAKHDRDVILLCAVAYFLLEGGRCFMMFLQSYIFGRVGNRILYEIRSELMAHVQRLPISFFDKNPTGRIVTRVTSDVVSLGEVFTQGLINMFTAVISLVAIVMAMAFISVKATVATLIVAPPIIWAISRLSMKIFDVLRESRRKLAAINAFVAENINGMRVLQLYARVGKNTDRFHDLSKDYRIQQLKSVRLYAMLWPMVSLFNAISVATALFFGGKLVLLGAVTTGAMVAFILHVRAFTEPFNAILEQYQTLQNSMAGAERIFTLLGELRESDDVPAREVPNKLHGEVRFENLSFRYGENLPYALSEVNLAVPPGASIALVGRTGSGKSTMISLLQRFYDPTDGRLLIDGRSVLEIPKRVLRSRLGVVQQDTFLFRGTIADNISLGEPNITREAIKRAAEMACLTELIARRPGGLDAAVEERGANLSVGERQLIAFARILAFNPDILILDEATSNIDSKTEGLIQEATRRVRQGRTSFIIAHRLSTIIDCDRIVVIDGGRIIEQGTHEELLAAGGHYAGLYHAQMKKSATLTAH